MIDKGLKYAYPQRFDEGGAVSSAVPDWVDPDYGYSPDRPRKPNMREMMEYMAGRSLEELHADPNANVQDLSKQASSILYGVVGSNTDTRDFNKLMASIPRGDSQAAVKTIGAATREMYGNQSRSQEELDKFQKQYADANIRINPVSPGLSQVISFDPNSNRYSSSLNFTDNQGVLLTGANPNTAASFGFTPEELDQARGQMIGEPGLAQYYSSAPSFQSQPVAPPPAAPSVAQPVAPPPVFQPQPAPAPLLPEQSLVAPQLLPFQMQQPMSVAAVPPPAFQQPTLQPPMLPSLLPSLSSPQQGAAPLTFEQYLAPPPAVPQTIQSVYGNFQPVDPMQQGIMGLPSAGLT